METYCVSCKKNTANENLSVRNTKQDRSMILSNCSDCGKKKLMFTKNLHLQGLHQTIVLIKFKINKIVKIFLVNGDKFMPELHLRLPGFTYSACGPFAK